MPPKLETNQGQNGRLSLLMQRFEQEDDSTPIAEIVQLYVEMEKYELAKRFLARAKKKFGTDPRLLSRIQTLRESLSIH